MHVYRSAILFIGLAVAATAAEPQWQSLQKTLQERIAQFGKNRDVIDKQVRAEFDQAIVQAGKGERMSATIADQKLELEKARNDFDALKMFPESDEYAAMELDYRLKVNRKFMPVSQALESLVKYANRANDSALIEEAVSLKEECEKKHLGGCLVPNGSKWLGTYDRRGRSVEYELTIQEVQAGGTFQGHVESNRRFRVHPSYDVVGRRAGAAIEFSMTASKHGTVTSFTAKGAVSGNRIIANVEQKMQNGDQWKGTLVLVRQ